MTLARALVPYPILSFVVLLLWLALARDITLGQSLLGVAMALGIPRLTARFWPDPPMTVRPLSGIRLLLIVIMDILIANWAVARLVLGPLDRLHPAFIEVPLDIKDRFIATILGSIVSLTPGTVSVDIDTERWVLLVHALDVGDQHELIWKIKRRYEAPLREIFAC
jgi:multicomponent K+:H+ antiporter subunit E